MMPKRPEAVNASSCRAPACILGPSASPGPWNDVTRKTWPASPKAFVPSEHRAGFEGSASG